MSETSTLEPIRCKREGCEEKARGLVFRYCSHECRNEALRAAAETIERLIEESNQ